MDKKTFEYDFCGWATKADLKCSDGRIIQKNSFKHQDGMIVPLVWNHQHNELWNVLGHALLEAREDGMYAYCSFNDTEGAMNAKMAVEHGDVKSLSIHANQLKQTGPYVNHGMIREVSIVLAGANPGAFIENVISHADGGGEGFNICYDEPIAFEEELEHAEEGKDSDSEGRWGSLSKHGYQLCAEAYKYYFCVSSRVFGRRHAQRNQSGNYLQKHPPLRSAKAYAEL